MEADVWNKCILDITNTGELQAKNIGVNFRGSLEVMGLDKINVLNVGEKLRLEVGVKPQEAGEITLDIQLAYHRAFDNTLYQLHIPKTVFIESKGTYQLDDVLLIHQSGVLVSHVSRKMGMEMDDDLFSGMFTAVQEFVKDTLGREENIGLNRMDYGERKILTEQGHLVFLTAIITGGEPMYLPLYMMEILKEVQEKYGEILDGWQGDYTKLQGIDEILRKLLQVTDAKGSDVEGFESSTVTSTIKQVEKADFEGGMKGAREALVADFIKTWEVEGYENAWNYLEKKGKEVDKEVISKASLKKIEAMKELMTVAKELNTDETEFKTFLDMAQQALESGDYESIDNYKNAFEKSINEAKSKHKKEIISRRIKNTRIIINQYKELGMDVEKAEHLLSESQEHFTSGNLEGAEMHVDQVERIADELHQENDVRIMLESVNELYAEAKEMDMEISEIDDLIGEANSELLTKSYQKALEPLQKAKKIIQDKVSEFVSGKAPKISVELPQRGLEVGTWNKCACEILNDGDLLAKNIDISFKGDVDLKAFTGIKKLDVGDRIRTEIGVRPSKAGEVPFEVILTYQKAFDDSYYQLDIPKKLVVDVSGTYQIEQIFLIMNSGVLVSQVARRMEEDIDKEIFSGMLIAVQDFIGDSFTKKGDIGLKRMDFGENKILIEEGKFTFLVTILVGDEPRFLPLFMLEVLNEVEEKYGSVLDGWDGTYTNLTGIEEVIGKLMSVIDERGVDIDGFTSGKVSSTIKLIETAQEDGVRIGGPETFAREILEIIEKKGAEEAWRLLENMGKDVEKESEELKQKREGMAELKHAFLRDMDEHYINEMGDNLDMYLRIADKITKVISDTRTEMEIKPTLPLQVVAIKSKDHMVRDAIKRLRDPLTGRINSKRIEILDPEKDWQGLNLELIPNKEIIHTAYKAQASKVISLLKHQSPWKIKGSLEKTGEYTLGVEGYPVKITAKMMDFKISTPENIIVKEFEETTIYIDKTVTEEIKAEGIAEELIALINNMRSELNVRDEDYIETQVFVADKTAELLESMKERIELKTRSYAVEFPFENIFEEGVSGYYTTEADIGGEKATVGIVVVEWEEE
jgi:tetratricopeptide (TPR) repeat protein